MRKNFFKITRAILASLSTALLVAGCAIKPPTSYDYDTSYDFSKLKSYAWIKSDEEKVSTLDNKRQINSIETVLNQKGFVKSSDVSKADFLLKTMVVTDKKVDVDRFYQSFGYHPFFNPAFQHWPHPWPHSSTTSVREYKIGTLVLDIVDASLKQVIWRGSVSKPLDIYKNRSPEERSSIALSNTQHMLSAFPPTPSEKE